MPKLCIWSPRPFIQSDTMASDFKTNLKVSLYHKPIIKIVCCTPENRSFLKKADAVFMTSQHAVQSIYQINEDWALLKEKKCIAIGFATANLLKKLNIFVNYQAKPPFNSEEIIADPLFWDLSIDSLAIISGQGGRNILQNAFLEKGLSVEKMVYYRRQKEVFSMGELNAFVKEKKINAVIISSCEIAKLVAAEIKAIETRSSVLNDWVVFSFSQRISDYCRQLGFQKIQTIASASKEDLYSAIIDYAKN